MLEIIAIVLLSTVFANLLQEKIGIPSVIFYLLIGLLFANLNPEILHFSPNDFHYLVLITLPFLIASDAFGITWNMIKKNYLSILILAVINVLLTVLAIVFFGNMLLPGLGILVLIILATTISPTDPVGVNSALANFKVPHRLSFKLESESLANDVVALSIFSIAVGILLGNTAMDITSISFEALKLLFLSLGIGGIIGYIGIYFLGQSKNVYYETFTVLTAIFLSFLLSDHYFHVSGILTVIVVMILMNEKIKKIWKKDKEIKKDNIVHPANHDFVGKILYFVAMISNAFLFIALGSLVDFFNTESFVWKYFEESFYIFIFITIVRAILMYFYSHISTKTKKIENISSKRWWAILTFGGMRGGISILMIFILASLIPDYKYMEELEAIVFNIVFLITFTYTPILIFIFKKYKKEFNKEYENDKNNN